MAIISRLKTTDGKYYATEDYVNEAISIAITGAITNEIYTIVNNAVSTSINDLFTNLTGYVDENYSTKVELSNESLTRLTTDNYLSSAISSIQLVKISDGGDDWAAVYQLSGINGVLGDTINIPKDQFLKNVKFNKSSNELEFTFALSEDGKENIINVPLSGLVDTYTAGIGISINNHVINISRSDSSEDFFFVDENGVGVSGIQDAIDKAVNNIVIPGVVLPSTGFGLTLIDNKYSVSAGSGITVDENGVSIKRSTSSESFFFVDAVSGVGVSGIQDAITSYVDSAVDTVTGWVKNQQYLTSISIATSESVGGIKSGGDVTVEGDGTIKVLSSEYAINAGSLLNNFSIIDSTGNNISFNGSSSTELTLGSELSISPSDNKTYLNIRIRENEKYLTITEDGIGISGIDESISSVVDSVVPIAVEEAISGTIDSLVSAAVEDALDESINDKIDEAVAEVVPQAVEDAMAEDIDAAVEEAISGDIDEAVSAAVGDVYKTVYTKKEVDALLLSISSSLSFNTL